MGKAISIYRTQISNALVVSTVKVGRVYETAISVNGRVSDPVSRVSKVFDAGFAHDAVVAFFLYPSLRDGRSSFVERVARAHAEVAS